MSLTHPGMALLRRHELLWCLHAVRVGSHCSIAPGSVTTGHPRPPLSAWQPVPQAAHQLHPPGMQWHGGRPLQPPVLPYSQRPLPPMGMPGNCSVRLRTSLILPIMHCSHQIVPECVCRRAATAAASWQPPGSPAAAASAAARAGARRRMARSGQERRRRPPVGSRRRSRQGSRQVRHICSQTQGCRVLRLVTLCSPLRANNNHARKDICTATETNMCRAAAPATSVSTSALAWLRTHGQRLNGSTSSSRRQSHRQYSRSHHLA